MKNSIYTLLLTVAALFFASCCGVMPCGKGQETTRTVTEFQETTETSAKGGSYIVKTPVERTVIVDETCPECLSSFCKTTSCCGTVSEVVLNRASAQGWSGNPHIGLIPTMKVLAE